MRKFITRNDYVIMVAIFIVAVTLGVIIGYFIFGPVSTYGAPGNYIEIEYETYIAPTEPEITCDYDESIPCFVEMPAHSYVVTSQDGYVVVLYAVQDGKAPHIKTVTNIPISPLPQIEQTRLENGINIYDEEGLFRILEDFGS